MTVIRVRTNGSQSNEFIAGNIVVSFTYTTYETSVFSRATTIELYSGILDNKVEIAVDSPFSIDDLKNKIISFLPDKDIIRANDPYDDIGNIVRFFSTALPDNSVGRDGDIFISSTNGKIYKRESEIYIEKMQINGVINNYTSWHISSIVDNSIGSNGDFLLRNNGDLYKKVSGVYVFTLNIRGPGGINGINGIDGAQIYTSPSGNYSGTANEGDINIVDAEDLYRYESGAWILKGKIKGDKGLKGDTGSTGRTPKFRAGPTNITTGLEGDIFFNTVSFTFYEMISGAYSEVGTLATPEPSIWRDSDIIPSNSTGKDGDYAIRHNGEVYKRESGVYVYKFRITGSLVSFPSLVDNSSGSDGDIIFVDNKFYVKESGVYQEKAKVAGGIIDWIALSNVSTITSVAPSIIELYIRGISTDTQITAPSSTKIELPSGYYYISFYGVTNNKKNISINILIDSSPVYTLSISDDATSVNNVFEFTSPVELEIEVDTFGQTLEDFSIDLSLMKIQETSNSTPNYYLVSSSKRQKRIKSEASGSGTLTIPLVVGGQPDSELVTVNSTGNLTIAMPSPIVDGKKVSLKIIKNSYNINFDQTNLSFNSGILSTDIVVSSNSRIVLVSDLISNKWEVSGFTNNVI